MQPMRLSESRSELKTPANMPSLRQLEFAFEQFAIHVVERRDAVVGQAFHLPARQTAIEAVALQSESISIGCFDLSHTRN